MIILIPSYYSGWERGQYYFDEKTEFVNCFSLSPQIDCLEKYPTYSDNYLPMINHLIENKLSIFSEPYLFNESEYLQKFSSLSDISNKKLINNSVSINDEPIKNNQTYDLTQNLVKIDGWFSAESNSIPETLILLVDDKPLLENHDFKFTKNNTELSNQVTVSWSIFFLSGYIESGCHLIHFEGIIDDEKILLDNQAAIQINNINELVEKIIILSENKIKINELKIKAFKIIQKIPSPAKEALKTIKPIIKI